MDTIVQIVVLSYVKTSSIMVQQANGEKKEVCQYKDFTGSDLDSKQIKTVYALIVIQTFGVQK